MPRKKMMLINHWASLRYDQPISLILPFLLDLLVKEKKEKRKVNSFIHPNVSPGFVTGVISTSVQFSSVQSLSRV